MEALYLLVPMSIGVVFFVIWLFFRASDSGQFDDLEGPGMRILHDDDRAAYGAPQEAGQDSKPAASGKPVTSPPDKTA